MRLVSYFVFILIFYMGRSLAQDYQFEWKLNCIPVKFCESLNLNEFNSPINAKNKSDILRHIKFLSKNSFVSGLSYEISNREGKDFYSIILKVQPTINKINIVGLDESSSRFVQSNLTLREGDYLDSGKLNNDLFKVDNLLIEKGIKAPKSSYQFFEEDRRLEIKYSFENEVILRKLILKDDGKLSVAIVNEHFRRFYGKKLDVESLKEQILKIGTDLKNQGYINSIFELERPSPEKVVDGQIDLTLDFKLGQKVLFQFYGNKILTRADLLARLRGLFTKFQLDLSLSGLELEIKKAYEDRGYFGTSVKTYVRDEINKDGWIYYFHINDGEKIKITNRVYLGNREVERDELENLFKQKTTDLVASGFYDKNFYDSSNKKIENYYLEKGFVNIAVDVPTFQISEGGREGILIYKIKEGPRAIVKSIKFPGLENDDIDPLTRIISTRVESPFVPMQFDRDLKAIIDHFQNSGFLYARFLSKEDNFIKYDEKDSRVEINIPIFKGPMVQVKDILVSGTVKTRNKAVYRECQFSPGDILTQQKMKETTDRLNALGLFASVEVSPLGEADSDGRVDVLVSVKERDFGSLELSPGYRTDLGIKVGSEVAYNNLLGMNRSARLKSELNQRINNEGLDQTRRSDGSNRRDGDKFPEYDFELGFAEPYIFNLPVSFTSSISHSRSRFISVDAYNTKANAILNKGWTKVFSTALGYQLENIRQFNATKRQDEGDYRIGSLLPSMAFDFRDSKIYTTSGSLLRLSFEYAGPALLSQVNTYPQIHFYKVISKNQFYFPMGPHLVLATSFSGGIQQNLAKDYLYDNTGNLQITDNGVVKREGHIPSVKVFRLGGINPVRGYSDLEINRLLGETQSITDVLVQNRAYFVNLNLEPRTQITDDIIFGVFFDAGRVYIDRIRLDKMRKSVGASFKYLTAVGTIDFHYGFKLDRREDMGEQVGRFHFSIGQF